MPDARLRAAVERTLAEAFANVLCFPANPLRDASGVCNLLFFASDDPLEFDREVLAEHPELERYFASIAHALDDRPSDLPLGVRLTDDHNPADLLGAEAFLDIRRQSSLFRRTGGR